MRFRLRAMSGQNHFSLRLWPVALRQPCLAFRVTSARPVFTIWWLTYLATAALTSAGIIDLARPHAPLICNVIMQDPVSLSQFRPSLFKYVDGKFYTNNFLNTCLWSIPIKYNNTINAL